MKAAGIILLLTCANSAPASDFEQIRRNASFEIYGIDTGLTPAQSPLAAPEALAAQEKEDFTWRRKFCWSRGKDLNADRMEMPASFCISSMKIIGAIHETPKLNLQGSVLSGAFDLKLGLPGDGLFKAVAVIFERKPLIQVCASAEAAYIEFAVLIDERGKIVSDPEIKSFYGSTPDTCASPWAYSEIKYSLKTE